MAMTKKNWSINALATEFGLDRRTVALRVNGIKPAAKVNGSPVWHLAAVAPVLADKEKPKQSYKAPSLPPGLFYLETLDSPVDKAAAYVGLSLIYRIGPLAASIAIMNGAPCKVAYAIEKSMTLSFMQMVEELGRQSGLEPWASEAEPDMYVVDAFEEVDWAALAKAAGEVVDLEAWKAYDASLNLTAEV